MIRVIGLLLCLSTISEIRASQATEIVDNIKTAQTLLDEAVDPDKTHAQKNAAATELAFRLHSRQVSNPQLLDRDKFVSFLNSQDSPFVKPCVYIYLARKGGLDFNELLNKEGPFFAKDGHGDPYVAALLEYYGNPESVFLSPRSWTYETPFDDLADRGDSLAQYKRARILIKLTLKTPINSLLPTYLADYLNYFDDSLLSEAVKLMYLSAMGGHPKAQYLYGILEWVYRPYCYAFTLYTTNQPERWNAPSPHEPLTKYWGVGTHKHNFVEDLAALSPSEPTKMLERSVKQEYPPALYFISRMDTGVPHLLSEKVKIENILRAAQYGLTDAIRYVGLLHINSPYTRSTDYARAYLVLHSIEEYDLSARAALMELFQFGNGEYSDHGYERFCDYRDSLKDDPQWYQQAFLFIATNPANKNMAEFRAGADFPYFNKYSYLTAAGNTPEALYLQGCLITESHEFQHDLTYGTSTCKISPKPLFKNAWDNGFKTDESLQALSSEYHREGNLYQKARLLVEGIDNGLASAKFLTLALFQFDNLEEFETYRQSKVASPDWIKDRFVDCGVVEYKAGNFSTSKKYLRDASEDDGKKSYYLGRIYEKKFENPQTHENHQAKLFPEIKSLYERASAQGFQKAAYRLAQYWLRLEYSTLSKKDQILNYMGQLSEAAKVGSAKAQFELGINLQNGGNGFLPSQKRSLEWIDSAAAQGNKKAKLHQELRGPANKKQKRAEKRRKRKTQSDAQKHFDEGLEWENKSESYRETEATLKGYYWRNATDAKLADRLVQDAVDTYNQTSGLKEKERLMSEAFNAYLLAYNLKHPAAARRLALCYLHGTGVQTKPGNREYLYLKLLREAANIYHDKEAQYDLAVILSNGSHSAPINMALSDFYMAAAAAQGHQLAQSNLNVRNLTPTN